MVQIAANTRQELIEEGLLPLQLGQVMTTPGVLDALKVMYPGIENTQILGLALTEYLNKHAGGDWGDLGDEDVKTNVNSLREHLRIFSAYHLEDGHPKTKIWIITEADRSSTAAMLPSEY